MKFLQVVAHLHFRAKFLWCDPKVFSLGKKVLQAKVNFNFISRTRVPQLTNDFSAFINQYVQSSSAILRIATLDENSLNVFDCCYFIG